MADKIPATGKWEGGSESVQEAAEGVRRTDIAVKMGADSNDAGTYKYAKKAQAWAKKRLDKANKRVSKKRSTSKQGENQY